MDAKIATAVDKVDLAAIRKRAIDSFDINKITDEELQKLVPIAVHCCMNGPVGVHKKTTFPIVGETSIIEVHPGFTNSSWRAFCSIVMTKLDQSKEAVKTCYTKSKFDMLWPACNFVPKK
jgi:hypothetical protein